MCKRPLKSDLLEGLFSPEEGYSFVQCQQDRVSLIIKQFSFTFRFVDKKKKNVKHHVLMSTDRELRRWGWESDDDRRDGGGV